MQNLEYYQCTYCTTMFKVSQEAQTLRKEDTRGTQTISNRSKSVSAVQGGTDEFSCPWRKSAFRIAAPRLDFYRASETIPKHRPALPERASHGICSIPLGQSTAGSYLAGRFEEPAIH